MKNQPPRHQWIEFDGNPEFDHIASMRVTCGSEWTSDFPSHEVIHFIEHSALEHLNKKCEMLVEALVKISNDHKSLNQINTDHGAGARYCSKVAREALANFRKDNPK